MRLHPAKDGLIPEPNERGVTTRDRGGNRLSDVVSRDSGYCVGVRSPLTIPAKDIPVVPAQGISGGKAKIGEDVRFDQERNVYYDLIRSSETDPVGLVCRTVADGDELLPVARVRVIQAVKPLSRDSARKTTAPVRKSDSTRKQNDQAVRAVLVAAGYDGPITKKIRNVVLEMIAMERHVSGITDLSGS